jgi:SAM-dependent methyltransferase
VPTSAATPSADPSLATAFRDQIDRSGYTRNGIQDALGASGDVLARPRDRAAYVRRLGDDVGPLATLIRLFLIDEPVRESVVAAALGPGGVEDLVALGLIEVDEGLVEGTIRLVPHSDVLIASDVPSAGDHPDHVAGIHRPSVTVADLTVRRPVDSALDVGTGNGIQAILVARHAERVVATDINERALAFAALNAALNGVANIDFRAGSFFAPIAGERFGLIVSNPPYVISPENSLVFRDSGLGRDRVSETLIRELPLHLEEGGFGTITVSWIQNDDEIAARPSHWLAGSGCDAWILHTAVESPLDTAAAWNLDLAADQAAYGKAIDRWVRYYRDEDIRALAYGALVLRRRTPAPGEPPNWIRSRELTNEHRVDPAPHLLRLFTGMDASARLAGDDALAAARVALVDGATITRQVRVDGHVQTESAGLSMARGLPFAAELDGPTAGLLASLDGQRAVGEVLERFAHDRAAPPERVRVSGLVIVRQLLESGMAEVVADPTARP